MNQKSNVGAACSPASICLLALPHKVGTRCLPHLTLCSLLLWLLSAFALPAAEDPAQDATKTLAPYFTALGGSDSGIDALPLKSTNVDAKVVGVMADVQITQVYGNTGATPLEAVYIFPASTRAAVYSLEMTIGERVVKAQVQKRAEAQRTYQQAKDAGKSASLLQQQRPNVFQMNVAHILPGDTVQVRLRYTELLVPTAGEYEFMFPTVVGPRYSNRPAAGAPETAQWVANPYLTKGVVSPSTFNLSVEVLAGMPLLGLRCDTHAVKPEFKGANQATVRLDGSQTGQNNRDFILKYRLAEGKIESGLLLSRGEKENFFMLTVQPPQRVIPADLPPREYIFVVDVSGSMHGFPLETAKGLVKQLFSTLRAGDTFNVLLFAGDSQLLSPTSLPADARSLEQALNLLDQQQGGGGTELLPALKRALALPQPAHEGARSVVVITDGFVDVEAEAFDLVRQNLQRANLFAFGIGSSVNRHLVEALAKAGQGEPFIVTRPDEAAAQAKQFRDYIGAPILTHVKADFGSFQAYAPEPSTLADVLAERPVVLLGKWKGDATGTITVRGQNGAGEYVQTFDVAKATMVESSPALGYLWARSRIAELADFGTRASEDERVQEVTTLGLSYNLLTAYTSFVAVDEVVRNAGGPVVPVKQPLPLPQGVSNSAVGGSTSAELSSTPEPAAGLLLLIVAGIFGFTRIWRKPCAA